MIPFPCLHVLMLLYNIRSNKNVSHTSSNMPATRSKIAAPTTVI